MIQFVPGIGAAFVNIGQGKNGFLFLEDIQQNASFVFEDEIAIEKKKENKAKINELIKVGRPVMIQVEKDPIGTKGPRLTTHISIPGRYIVLTPYDDNLGISRKIQDRAERQRIRDIIKSVKMPKGLGCIVRTAAQGMSENYFKRELKYLLDHWKRIKFNSKKSKAPELLHEEYNLIMRIIRDEFTDNVEKVVVDSQIEYKKIVRFINSFLPPLKNRVYFYKEREQIFEAYGVEKEIEKIFRRKILLKNGGVYSY